MQGAFMPAGLMVRNRLENKFIDETALLTLGRAALAANGLAVADVTARAVDPLPGTYTGLVVKFDGEKPGDLTPPDDPATNPLSAGTPNYSYYTLEVVQRIGYDSFTPDNGVLIAKNKDGLRGRNGGPNEFNSYIWVIDAHPEDINEVDYVRPGGEKVMRTVADYRQLNDALFHAGLDSGSLYEWEDAPNRLHFYIIDLRKDKDGILVYTLAVRSLDGAGPQPRGAAIAPPEKRSIPKVRQANTPLTFTLANTGGAPAAAAGAPFGADVYRLSVSVDGQGWTAGLQNALAAVKAGASIPVSVFVSHAAGASKSATVTLRATSESDPSKSASAFLKLSR
jgi:hypothetical protein